MREIPTELAEIRDLREVRVASCGLATLPDWFADRPVESLDLIGNGLSQLPPVILEMSTLRHLGMSNNQISYLSPEIDRLARLEALALSFCGLRSLPSSVRNMSRLVMLDLGFNSLGDPDALILSENIEQLVLSGNGFHEIPHAVRRLSKIRVLECSAAGTHSRGYNLEVRSRGPVIRGHLRRVIGSSPAGQGKIEVWPSWLSGVSTLEWIDLSGQRIKSVPESIGRLRNLEGLLLPGNLLQRLPDSLCELSALKVLSVEQNQISALPENLHTLSGLSFLGVEGNDLPLPPEVLSQPAKPDRIWDYLARTGEDHRHLDEAKVLVVGEGSVGKSSLVRRLTRGDFDPDERKTEGIDVTRWSLTAGGAEIAVNLWDFGGQEIMHATHQFFLTRRSVYLLVVDARQSEEQNRIEYWLKLVQGFSAGSPVILIGNKCDKFGLDIDQRGLREKYPDIVDILETSCFGNLGIDDVRGSLSRTVGSLPHVRDLLPTSFFMVKSIWRSWTPTTCLSPTTSDCVRSGACAPPRRRSCW